MNTERTTEQMLQDKGLNAPRLNPQHIDNTIVSEYYHVVPNTALTICVLTLQNGFQVTGENASVSLENFDEEIGRKTSRENARDKIWVLEGYVLKQRLYIESLFGTKESK